MKPWPLKWRWKSGPRGKEKVEPLYLGSSEDEESPPLMKWRETRAEAEWAWLGLHGDGDREDSLLAATLNIFFFQLRLAPKNLVAGFHRFFTAFANNLGISRDRKRKAKRERKWTVWSLCFSGCVSDFDTSSFSLINRLNSPNKSYMATCRSFKIRIKKNGTRRVFSLQD